MPKVGSFSGGRVNTLAMGKPDFPISSQTLTKTNPATSSVKPPMSVAPPPTQAPPTPTNKILSGGFQSTLNPMDPAAIGGSMMRPQLSNAPSLSDIPKLNDFRDKQIEKNKGF